METVISRRGVASSWWVPSSRPRCFAASASWICADSHADCRAATGRVTPPRAPVAVDRRTTAVCQTGRSATAHPRPGVARVLALQRSRTETERPEGVDHDGVLVGALLADRRLDAARLRPVDVPCGMQGDRADL